MHEIDRSGSATAVRLAALAALRKAQAEGGAWDMGETKKDARAPGSGNRRGRPVSTQDDGTPETGPTPRLNPEGSAGVFAAVEAAVRKSRMEFIGRLLEYREKLDCGAFRVGADLPETSMDDAQFIAHRIAGVGKTLGYADLGEAARQTETAILTWKRERSQEARKATVSRICDLAGLIETICDDEGSCYA